MKRRDHWRSHWRIRVAELHRFMDGNQCRKCGQSEWKGHILDHCPLWNMRLPRKKETSA